MGKIKLIDGEKIIGSYPFAQKTAKQNNTENSTDFNLIVTNKRIISIEESSSNNNYYLKRTDIDVKDVNRIETSFSNRSESFIPNRKLSVVLLILGIAFTIAGLIVGFSLISNIKMNGVSIPFFIMAFIGFIMFIVGASSFKKRKDISVLVSFEIFCNKEAYLSLCDSHGVTSKEFGKVSNNLKDGRKGEIVYTYSVNESVSKDLSESLADAIFEAKKIDKN